jgi:hypothetical protein
MSFTVVPLHNLSLPEGTEIPFADGFVLCDLPEWLREDRMLDNLSLHDKTSILQTKNALVAEYEAASIGERDPAWTGTEPRSIQHSKSQSAILANLALWLRQPSPVCFMASFHAISGKILDRVELQPIVQETGIETPLYCHPDDFENRPSIEQIAMAEKLHAALLAIPRKNSVWTAIRAVWAGLTMYSGDIRHSLFWIALEALFGSDD